MSILSESEILSVARDMVTEMLELNHTIDRQQVLEVYNILHGYPKNGLTMGGTPVQIDPGLPYPLLMIGEPKRL